MDSLMWREGSSELKKCLLNYSMEDMVFAWFLGEERFLNRRQSKCKCRRFVMCLKNFFPTG